MNVMDLISFVEARKLFSRHDTILLAVSGGIDSVVMAHLFHEAKFHFAIAHCNFGLRGSDSDKDAEFVKRLALQFNVHFHSEKFNTENTAAQRGISIQMAARDLRYDWFEKIRNEHGYQFIATAHHLDDQVETFLINLIRGTGIAGLHGIPVKHHTIIRPMMFARRSDFDTYTLQHHIPYRTDRTNNETKYLRNKIRHEVIPLLCSINPEFAQGITETIRRVGEFEQIGNEVLDKWCRGAVRTDGKDHFIEIDHLLSVTPVEPYAWALFSPFGFNETQVSNILGCLKKDTRKVFHSLTHRIVKERTLLVISTSGLPGKNKPVQIPRFARTKTIHIPVALSFKRIPDVKNYAIPAFESTASLDFDKLHFPLTLRKWQLGDAFYPLGMKKRKKLSDFFIDQKFSMKEREQTWLLCSGHDIAWIIGHRIDHRYRITQATKEILNIVMREV